MLQLDAAALRQRLPAGALVQALEAMFRSGCEVPLRHTHAIGNAGSSLLMPAWVPGRLYGVKTINIFPGNSARGLPGLHAVYLLFDAQTGVPLALMDGSELTSRRTAAASALAARFLARDDARHLLVLGAGRVAALLPEAMRSVRPGLAQVTVWNHRRASAETLVASLRAQGWRAEVAPALETAVRAADLISCATLSTAPLVQGAWLTPGTHLDLIGSFTPAMRETDGACFSRSRVFVDTDEAAAKAGDLLQAQAEGHFDPTQVQATLTQLCRGERHGRATRDEITVFKSVGSALEDLAAAELALAGTDNRGLPA